MEKKLTPIEFRIFELLTLKMGQKVTRQELAKYTYMQDVQSNVIDVHIKNLRKKRKGEIEIITIRNSRFSPGGYLLESPQKT